MESFLFSLSLSPLVWLIAPAPRDGDYANAIEVPRAIALIDGAGRGRRRSRVGRQGLLTPRREAVTLTLQGQQWI